MAKLSSLPMSEDSSESLGDRAAAWLGLRGRRETARSTDQPFLQFAEILAEAPNPTAIAEGLVKVAGELSGARRVELVRERGWGATSMAAWPVREAETTTRRSTLALRDEDWRSGRTPIVGIPARHAGRTIATLWLYSEQPRHWPGELVRTLSALATMAASAGFAPEETAEPLSIPAHDLATGLPNASFLEAFLNFAVAQAKRKHEPLTLICLGMDRHEALLKLHGPEIAREASRCLAQTISGTLRASDLVARLDESRLIAALPNTRHDDALLVAETLRDAITSAGLPTTNMPVLTACLGVVTYPDHAPDATTLLHAATEALVEARATGRSQIYGPTPLMAGRLRLAQYVG